MSSQRSSGSLDSLGWDPNKQLMIATVSIFSLVTWLSGNIMLASITILMVLLPAPWIIVYCPSIQRKLLFHSWYFQAEKPLDDPCLWGVLRGVNRPIGDLGCWFIPSLCTCPRTCSCNSDTVVVYCHGSSGSRGNSYRVELVNFLSSLGCAVYSFDYRGYADSPGHSTQVNSIQDARQVVAFARVEHPERRVVLYGHSMGTGIVCQTAYQLSLEDKTVDAIILEAPFLSIPDVMLKYHVIKFINWLPFYRNFIWQFSDLFKTKDVIGQLSNVLILFAENDEVIPVYHATQLHKLCQSSSLHLISDGGHNFLIEQDSVRDSIDKHLRREDL